MKERKGGRKGEKERGGEAYTVVEEEGPLLDLQAMEDKCAGSCHKLRCFSLGPLGTTEEHNPSRSSRKPAFKDIPAKQRLLAGSWPKQS